MLVGPARSMVVLVLLLFLAGVHCSQKFNSLSPSLFVLLLLLLPPPPLLLLLLLLPLLPLPLLLLLSPPCNRVKLFTTPRDLLAVDLGKLAMRGLLNRNPELDPKDIDYILFGTVIQARRTTHDTHAIPSTFPR